MLKNFFKNQELQLDEIVFQGRNKDYGAYVLRHDSDRILTKSMFYGIALFGVLSAVPFLVKSLQVKAPVEKIPASGPYIIKNIPPDEVVPPKQTTVQVAPPKANTFDSTVPTPSHNPPVEKPAAKPSDYQTATPSTQTVAGTDAPTTYIPPITAPIIGDPVKPVAPPAKVDPPKDPNKIESKVDVEANFAGGVDAFRAKVQDNFDGSEFEGSGETLKTVVTFVVERDGSISNVKASGSDAAFNRAAEQTIRSIKGRWTPAKLKGEAVRSYFRFPVSMAFE